MFLIIVLSSATISFSHPISITVQVQKSAMLSSPSAALHGMPALRLGEIAPRPDFRLQIRSGRRPWPNMPPLPGRARGQGPLRLLVGHKGQHYPSAQPAAFHSANELCHVQTRLSPECKDPMVNGDGEARSSVHFHQHQGQMLIAYSLQRNRGRGITNLRQRYAQRPIEYDLA